MSIECPLCDSTYASPCAQMRYDRIWDELKRQWGAAFSSDIIERHTPSSTTVLMQCRDCGLQYFWPTIPGDSGFYDELCATSSTYYVTERWEFEKIAQILTREDKVLDIACGTGAFLAKIQDIVSAAVGIDTNPEAVRRGRAAGLAVQLTTLDEFARNHPDAFDVVCALQVVEHLPKVRPFLRAALSCIKPGGWLIVSVPNRDRFFRADFEPLDCPPHHMSRWGVDQLVKLGDLLGCRVYQTVFQLETAIGVRACISRRFAEHWGLPFLRQRNIGARALARMIGCQPLYSLYRRAGLLDRWRIHGHGLLAVYQADGPRAVQGR